MKSPRPQGISRTRRKRVLPWRRLALSFLLAALCFLPGLGHCASKPCDPAKLVIAVDAGHGPKRSGAQSARGVPEYAFNLAMAKRIVDELRQRGFAEASLIEEDGKDLSLAERPARANARGADVFLSVHHDSVQSQYLEKWEFQGKTSKYADRFSGHSLFVSRKNARFEDSFDLAERMGQALRDQGLSPTLHHAEKIKGENRELLDKENGVYRYDGLRVLYDARMPAVLLECGIIVNRDEETALTDPERRSRIACAVADAITAYCRDRAKAAPSP